jgi:PAS domain S-box-containing protein
MFRFLSYKNYRIYLLQIVAIAFGYFVLARISLFLSFQTSNATPVWPPSGYAFAVMLLMGYRIAPAIFLGAFIANLVVFQLNNATDLFGSLWVSFIIGIGNMSEALVGYFLLRKIIPSVQDNNYFEKTNHVFLFSFAAIIAGLVSSIIGSGAVLAGNIIHPGDYVITWLTWWMGDVSGILLITPFILTWRNLLRPGLDGSNHWEKRSGIRLEAIAMFVLIALVSGIVFNNWIFDYFIFQWAYWVIPFLVWAAIRFEHHETATALLICSAIAIWGTLNGGGPFAAKEVSAIALNESLLILQAFIGIIVTTTLTLNASVNQRKQTEARLRELGDQLEKRVNFRTAELKETAEKLELVNKQLTEAQRLAHIGNWEWDVPNNRISWSDELYRIYGLTPQTFEASYENYMKYIHPDEQETLNNIIQNSYSNHDPFSFYHRIIRPDGNVRILHGRGEVIVNEKNEVIRMLGTAQDVTEIKHAEEEIKQLAENLARYNRQLEQTNKELESFTFVASHDLQEPLRKIRTFLSLITEHEPDNLSATSRDYMKRTINAAERMQQLINDLLLYSRTTSSPEHFKKTDLNSVLEKVLSDMKELIEEKQVSIKSDKLPPLLVIPFQVEQLFSNLISNSLKFSKPDMPLEIKVTAGIEERPSHNGNSSKYHTIKIKDNGIGFDSRYNEKIFHLFQRLHGRHEYNGTGIGLSICKKIMESHGGFIKAHGELGQGAEFIIYFPEEPTDV